MSIKCFRHECVHLVTRRVVLLKETLPTWILGAFLVWKQSVYCSSMEQMNPTLVLLHISFSTGHAHPHAGGRGSVWELRPYHSSSPGGLLKGRKICISGELKGKADRELTQRTHEWRATSTACSLNAGPWQTCNTVWNLCETCVKHAVFTPRFACVIRMTREIPAPRQV